MTMKHYLDTHVRIALILLTLALASVVGAFVAHVRSEAAVASIRERMGESDRYMFELSELTDRNGADEAITGIIPACDRRAEYESLLVKLAELGKKDLLLLQNLFEACGAFDAQRKALMVAKLEREFESYKTFRSLLDEFGEEEAGERMTVWEDIVIHEKHRSSLLNDLYGIQKSIISELIVGGSPSGERVRTLAGNAQDISELISVYDHRIDAARESLTP